MGLDGLEFVVELENEFDVQIDDSHAASIRTLGDASDLIQRLRPEINREQLWDALLKIVSRQFGVPPASLHRHTRFIEDLDLT